MNIGMITASELGIVLRAMNQNFTDQQLKKIIASFDDNGDGEIDFEEFVSMMSQQESNMREVDELQEAFNVFDKDGDGTITASELERVMQALGENVSRATIELMISSVDVNGDGEIDFGEFKQMMRDGPPVAKGS